MGTNYVVLIDQKPPPGEVGGKALHLHRLMKRGLRVPRSLVVTWKAYDRYMQGDVRVLEDVHRELAERLDPSKTYAVRSSANIEDTLEHSFAGQFKTELEVRGVERVAEAVRSTWESTHSPAVKAYLTKLPEEKRELHMGVIVQEMVKPVVSGVTFSRNPMTGEDEVIVEAVRGVGTALVQDGATPLHWVWQGGQWKSRSGEEASVQDVVEPGLIEGVVEETRRIAQLFRLDLDLEWVYDGQALYWVQMREITSLKDLTIYSNRIAKEMLPGMIKPLVWSVNVPLVNKVWVDVLTELVGKNDLKLNDLAKSFYYRAYFNLSALGRIWAKVGMPRESLEMMMGIVPRAEGQRTFKMTRRMLALTPRLVGFLRNKWRLGERFEREFPALRAHFETYDWQAADGLDGRELMGEIDRLYTDVQRLVYYNINVPILMAVYNALLGQSLAKKGLDLRQFDVMEGMTEHLVYDPQVSLRELRNDYARLDKDLQVRIKGSSFAEFESLERIDAFQTQVTNFLRRFGHLSNSGNDFSSVPWRERPEMILKLVTQVVEAGETAGAKRSLMEVELGGLRGYWMKRMYKRAQRFHLYREQISSLYTYAYGLFRPYFLALGRHFVREGLLVEAEDVFYLTKEEVRTMGLLLEQEVFARKEEGLYYRKWVADRQAEMERCREVVLPGLIYGDAAPVLEAGSGEKLSGVPTSRGYCRGRVRVVRGLEDFDKVLEGDVVVIPYSDVSWTPLFARAGAVVAESGGMLSHSSIVAREYQIPAVVSVEGAVNLPDGVLVSVDGFRGEVIVHEEHGDE